MQQPQRILLFIYLIISTSVLIAQSNQQKLDSILSVIGPQETDSMLVMKLGEVWDQIKFSDQELSETLIGKLRNIAEASGSPHLIDIVNYNEALIFYLKGDYRQAKDFYQKSYTYFTGKNDTIKMMDRKVNLISVDYALGNYDQVAQAGDSLISMAQLKGVMKTVISAKGLVGLAQENLGNSLLAMTNYLECISHYKEIGDTARWADYLNYLGNTQLDLRKYAQAEQYYKQAADLYESINDHYYLTQALNNIGLTYLEQSKLDSATHYLRWTERVSKKVESDVLALVYFNLAKVHRKSGENREAERLFLNALKMFEDYGKKANIVEVSHNYGKLLLEAGRLGEAGKVLKKAEKLLEEVNSPSSKVNLSTALARYYGVQGDFKRSTTYWQQSHAIKDSITQKEAIRQQNELLVIYETEQKEKALLMELGKNERLQQEGTINQLRIRNLWIISGLLLGVAILTYILLRQINIRKQIEHEAERKSLEQELEYKQRELTTHTLHLVSKNNFLTEVKSSLEDLGQQSEQAATFKKLIHQINIDQRADEDWTHFERYFKEVHTDFDEKLKQVLPDLTGNEIRLITLMKMNLSSKEIAGILNITPESVNKARYRLKKKLNLDKDQGLQQFILSL